MQIKKEQRSADGCRAAGVTFLAPDLTLLCYSVKLNIGCEQTNIFHPAQLLQCFSRPFAHCRHKQQWRTTPEAKLHPTFCLTSVYELHFWLVTNICQMGEKVQNLAVGCFCCRQEQRSGSVKKQNGTATPKSLFCKNTTWKKKNTSITHNHAETFFFQLFSTFSSVVPKTTMHFVLI